MGIGHICIHWISSKHIDLGTYEKITEKFLERCYLWFLENGISNKEKQRPAEQFYLLSSADLINYEAFVFSFIVRPYIKNDKLKIGPDFFKSVFDFIRSVRTF